MAPTKFTKPFPRKFKTGSKGSELSIYAEGLVPKDQKLSSQICIPATSSHVKVGYKVQCKKAARLPGLKRPAQPHPLSGTRDPPFRVFDSTDLGDVGSYLVLDVWESESDGASSSSSSSSSTRRSKERDVRPSFFHRFRSHLHQRQASRGRSRVRSRKPWWNRRTAPSQVFDRRWGREERVSGVETSRENLLHQGLYAQPIAQKRYRAADEDKEASPCFKRFRYGQTAQTGTFSVFK